MRRNLFMLLTLVLACVPGFSALAQSGDSPVVEISAPIPGIPLKGVISIDGTTAMTGFQSWEITFGYANDSTGSWFLIDEGQEIITQSEITQWDTATITDGDYNLRLTIYLEGGRREHFIVNGLRVRNYSPVETITPIPSQTPTPYTETPLPSQTPTVTQAPTETSIPNTPTPLPTNPATITQNDITNSLSRGAAGAAAVFVLIGFYISIKRMLRR
jgi:hypothetical protein